jgi:hypothetical protein
MRTLLLSLVLVAGTAHAEPVDSAEAREHTARVQLTYEGQLVEIADRDVLTARLGQDTAEKAIARAQKSHDTAGLVYWSHRLETAHADEVAALARCEQHRVAREDARTAMRAAIAEIARRTWQEARR